MGDNVILNKTYEFAKGIVVLCYKLQTQKKEYILSKQLLRSVTSVGANVEEGVGGFSKKDFRFKMSIAYKEARESRYWLRLIRDTGLMDVSDTLKLLDEIEQKIKILYKIVKNSGPNSKS